MSLKERPPLCWTYSCCGSSSPSTPPPGSLHDSRLPALPLGLTLTLLWCPCVASCESLRAAEYGEASWNEPAEGCGWDKAGVLSLLCDTWAGSFLCLSLNMPHPQAGGGTLLVSEIPLPISQFLPLTPTSLCSFRLKASPPSPIPLCQPQLPSLSGVFNKVWAGLGQRPPLLTGQKPESLQQSRAGVGARVSAGQQATAMVKES